MNFTPSQRLFLGVTERLDRFATQMNARIDAYNATVDAAQGELEEAATTLRDDAVREIRALVTERTEPRKAGIFG